MNRILRAVSAGLLTAALLTAPFAGSVKASPGPVLQQQFVEDNVAFGVQMYRALGRKEGNVFFSPYSVSTALGMTYAGARGNTAEEMKTVLHFQLGHAALDAQFHLLSAKLMAAAQESGQKLNIANGLALTGGGISDSFITTSKTNYDAEIFSGGLQEVNDWVNKKTEGKIPKILEELNADSVCVLLNAIYFKGTWADQFQKNQTSEAPFFLTGNGQTTAQLMYRKGSFQLLTEKDFQAIAIPYKGGALSMVILLPNARDGLAAVEKQVTAESLRDWLARLDGQPAQSVELSLPKFKLETTYDLVPPLKKLGMQEAFAAGAADFSGMGPGKGDLWIGQIVHKAFVEVNEEGTEAAAATAVEMVTKSIPVFKTPEFRVDHPFIFIIRDNRTHTLLFLGRVADPGSK
jgi:serpin B